MTRHIEWFIAALLLFVACDLFSQCTPGRVCYSGPSNAASVRISSTPAGDATLVVTAANTSDADTENKGAIFATNRSTGGIILKTSSDTTGAEYVRKSTLTAAGPTYQAEFGIAVHAGKIYVIGGIEPAGPQLNSTRNNVYDPVADSWSAKAVLPTARRGLSAVAAWNDKIYAIGGTTGTTITDVATGLIEEYDTSANSWATKSTYISSRAFAVVAATRTIYIGGGCDRCTGANASNKLEIYNPETDALMGTPATMGTGRYAAAGGLINGAFYIFGGHGTTGPLSSIEKWTSNSWETKTAFSRTVASAAYAVGGENLYVSAGKQSGAVSNELIWYSAGTDVWQDNPGVMEKRYLPGGAFFDRYFYTIGGYDTNAAAFGVNHRFGPVPTGDNTTALMKSSTTFSTEGRSEINTNSGFGALTLTGPQGGCQVFRDIDNGGWTKVYYLDGAQTVMTDLDGRCD